MRTTNFAATLTILLLASPLSAQVYAPSENPPRAATGVDTQGFNLGIGLNGSSIAADDLGPDVENGPGFNFRIGYGFTPSVTLFFGATGANMNEGDYQMGHADLGVRGYFPRSSQFVPFIEGAITGRALVVDGYYFDSPDNFELTGIGFTGGAGVDLYGRRLQRGFNGWGFR